MTQLHIDKVNYSAITSDTLAEVHSGKIFEVIRNQRPDGVFLIRKPQTEEELQSLAEMLKRIMLEPTPTKQKKSKK